MRSLKLAGIEFRRLTGERMVLGAVAVIALVPLLYGALYLWAFWDPYTRLDKLPVALVNADNAVSVSGKRISAGSDLSEELLDRGTFKWEAVSAAEAASGLKSGRYYMELEIPSNFSASLGTANSEHPRRARLRVIDNESANLLAGQIGGRVFTEVRAAAGASASRTYLDKIFVGFKDARGGLVDAAAGADTLAEGLATARTGAGDLADGTSAAHNGAAKLQSGLSALATGATTADSGARKLAAANSSLARGLGTADAGASKLAGGASQVAGGAGELADGTAKLAAGSSTLAASASKLAAGAAQVDAGVNAALAQVGTAVSGSARVRDGAAGVDAALRAYVAAHPEAASDPTFATALGTAAAVKAGSAQLADGLTAAASQAPALTAGTKQVADGSSQLAAGAGQLAGGLELSSAGATKLAAGSADVASGSRKLESGVTRAASGSAQIVAGSTSLAAGTHKLAAGAGSAATGAGTLLSGLSQLDVGAHDLSSGLSPAITGSRSLADGLTAGAKDLPAYSAKTRTANAAMMSDPVALDTERMNEVPNYGTGFAPYFIPLALWVGALMAYFVVRPLPERALASGAPARVAAFAGYWPAALIGTVQAVVMVLVLRTALGLTAVSPLALYGFTIVSALCFVACLQWLAAAFGPTGKLISIVLLMLQLTSSAGTFPLETVPPFFQVINPFLPMTYVVAGLRQAISGGDMVALGFNTLVLTGFAAAALVGTTLTARGRAVWTMDRLRPTFEL